MEHLPQTKGKGLLMFARRRQRIDEIAAEHEELRSKGIPVEAPEISSKPPPVEDIPFVHQNGQIKQQLKHKDRHTPQQIFQQPNAGMNGLDSCPDSSASKPLVSNRTAKPFPSGLNQSVPSPRMKKSEHFFKVPVPVNTSPQVWSPTGDIIASRDERIAVPAIKSVILPEMKRRGTSKTNCQEPPEEDYFSLGAEACNFMQAPTIRQKHPPPVLPKPAINPHCPPWSADNSTHSHLTPPSPLPAQRHWTPHQPQPGNKPWAPLPTRPSPQQHASDDFPNKPSTSYKPTWLSEPQQSPAPASPSQSKVPWTKLQTDTGSVISCPPQRVSSYVRPSKAPPMSSVSEIGSSDGPMCKGKGAELFAKRQSRMEKFVVDAQTVQANTHRSPSPTLSMPSTWKYSSIVRAPPPVSYNPIVSPFYPLVAQKQPLHVASSNMNTKTNKEKPKTAQKHLSVMDVMKHQPYQLDSSLFTYSSNAEAKGPSPKSSLLPLAESKHTPLYLQDSSPVPSTGSVQSFQRGALTKPSGPVSAPYPFTLQSTPAETPPPAPQASVGKAPAPCMINLSPSKVFSSRSTPPIRTGSNAFLSTSSFPLNSKNISRSSLPMAPKPKFSAKKATVRGKQWKPVVMLH